jgi:hypothetical protein
MIATRFCKSRCSVLVVFFTMHFYGTILMNESVAKLFLEIDLFSTVRRLANPTDAQYKQALDAKTKGCRGQRVREFESGNAVA